MSPKVTARPIAFYTKTWRSGGAGLFAQELAHGVADAGYRVIFIAPPAENPQFDKLRPNLTRIFSRREAQGGSRFQRLVASMRRVASSVAGLARARLQTSTYLISIPDPLIFALPFMIALRMSGARIIYIVHDPLPHAWKLPATLRWLENGSFAAAYCLSSALVVLSEAARDTLVGAYPLGRRQVAVIEHGSFSMCKPLPAPCDGTLLLFGTLRRNKGIREAIEGVIRARERGARVRLIIAGSPDPVEPDYWAECLGLIRSSSAGIQVEEGYVNDERLEELIGNSDAFLLPYRNFHSQSGVAILAASNARPVIASHAGGIGDLIKDGMAGLGIDEPVDGNAVCNAIMAFTQTSPEVWQQHALEYCARMLKERAWPVIGRHYAELAESIAR
ncbi:glycosyltransferase family 4 protein [Novosphingobium sp. SG707]|uniref:glycosyltransferase family 4 protein n=1 Tax=Novosphingobium sp. SG707 TaxID=2586996 RepID=UPI00144701BC|nr:glycosyltransferase family 4 protein [Novosphingobium sp. SG707]NKJ02908.1 glycosyltransferase involved in cell wall biosynthesis [Novosphingobium sp. SG707]